MQVFSRIFSSKIQLIYNAFSLFVSNKAIYRCARVTLMLRNSKAAVGQR